MQREFSRWGLALVLILGLVVRIGFVSYEWDRIAAEGKLKDPDDYGRLALNLVQTGTFGYPKVPDVAADSSDKKTPDGEPDMKAVGLKPADSKAAVTSSRPAFGSSSAAGAKGQESDEATSATKATPAMRSTAYRPPFYPALLTLAALPDFVKGKPRDEVRLDPFVVIGLHILLGIVTIGLVYYIAWRLDYRWGWVPALAVAVDPILLYWGGQMMTETLVTMLAVFAWALYLRLVRPNLGEIGRKVFGMRMSIRVSWLLGLVLGLAVLTRPTMLPWAVLMIASLSLRGNDAGNRVAMITAALIAMSIVNAGWMIRNKQQLEKPIWTTTHGGYTLLLANNPPLYKHFETVGPGRDWDANEFHKLWSLRHSGGDPTDPKFWEVELPKDAVREPNIDELKDDRLAQEAAIATIRSNPETFLKSCVYRAGWLWALFPYVEPDRQLNSAEETVSKSEDERLGESRTEVWSLFDPRNLQQLLIGIWYAVWFGMAILGVFWLREALSSRVWLMPILLCLTLTAIHMIYWSNMRMRAPMMPVVYMIACWPLMRCRTPSRL